MKFYYVLLSYNYYLFIYKLITNIINVSLFHLFNLYIIKRKCLMSMYLIVYTNITLISESILRLLAVFAYTKILIQHTIPLYITLWQQNFKATYV